MRTRTLGIAAAAIALWVSCDHDTDRDPPSGQHPTGDRADGGGAADAGDPPDSAPAGEPPVLGCDPAEAAPEDLCSCMADIVCDQIYFCLDAEEIAGKPEYWSPRARCAAELVEDCLEDLGSDPGEYLPADFPACVGDLGAATCADYGDFASVSDDFPATCENLRALDTALGIAQ